MSPSTTVRRAGFVTASALALALSGAVSAGPASAVTLCGVGQVLNSAGDCVKKTVTSVTPPPKPSSGGSSGGGVSVPLPSVPKVPLPTGSSSGGSSSGGSSGGSSSGSGGVQLPKLPGVKLPSGTSGGTGSVTGGSGGLTGPSVPGAATTTATNDPSTVPGAKPADPNAPGNGGMLSPASAYLPATGILGFTNFSGTGGALSSLSAVPSPLLANYVPSPLLASQPAAQLAAVQAPLLAAGEDAGSGGGSTVLTSFGGYALPGLLVVLATAVVGVVGAGNVRVWQARMAARRT
jgi:hypothetical protein